MSAENVTPILFLSGAGLPAWIWDNVIESLPPGTPSHVAEYPNAKNASLADYADAAVAQVDWPHFAIVAHSAGGVVAAEILARHQTRAVALLGVSAVFPESGRSFVRSMPVPARFILGAVMRVAGTKPPAKAIRSGLTSGLSEEISQRIVNEFDPESLSLYVERTHERNLPQHTMYLVTEQDKELPAAVQQRSAATMNATTIDRVATGHLPMIEQPRAVNSAIGKLLAARS